jgi:NAD(P)-dependent dehydrogenase (short-subunit alcohol dehydrogenase family)
MIIKGKVAIVTGASSGIGKAISFKLAASGVKLALVARTSEKLDSVIKDIKNQGAEAISVLADLTKSSNVEAMVRKVVEKYGQVDILINCAFWGPPGSLEQTTEEFWDHTLDTTLKAPFLCTRAVVPYMRRQGGGRIVNIGSKAGKVGEDNRTAYCAAKWGLEGLSAALSEELTRDNIHVHLISPAATNTPFWPGSGAKLTPEILARFVPPETIAEAVVWVIQQPDQVHIPDVPVYNFRNPFEGKSSPFAE